MTILVTPTMSQNQKHGCLGDESLDREDLVCAVITYLAICVVQAVVCVFILKEGYHGKYAFFV